MNPTPADDPWLTDRIDDVAAIYNLTVQAGETMSNIPVAVHRNEPGFQGTWGRITASYSVMPVTLGHSHMR